MHLPTHPAFGRWLLVALGVVGMASHGFAQTSASAGLTPTGSGSGLFDYSITLQNTGATNVGTFWYAWTPGQDYLPSSPADIVSPAGWTFSITGSGGGSNGYAILWTAGSSPTLAPGKALTFSFDIASAPDKLAGNSPFYPTTPVGTSVVYQGGSPFSGGSSQFVVTSVPEPSSLALLCASGLGIGYAGWRRRRAGARSSL